jgi:ABC-2 type transport system ATP-binding protein
MSDYSQSCLRSDSHVRSPRDSGMEVSRQFGNRPVLERISLEIPRAEIFGLLGPSGAGKTTLVRMMAGIDIADSGEIHMLNERMPKLHMLKHIGYMAQSDALYTELTAKENLEFFASLFGLKGAARKRRMEEVMTLVHLTDHLNKPVQHFSGGMKRRLSLAMALLHSPQILLLDEPTVGIDPVLRQLPCGT